MYTIAICQHKGGVGKTTTALNLAGCLAARGNRVLVVDMDPQENATIGSGVAVSDSETGEGTMAAVIRDKAPIVEAIQSSVKNGFDVARSHYSLTYLDMELASRPAREWILDRALDKVRSNYDYIILDTQPHLGVGTLMSVVSASEIIVPLKLDFYSLRGLSIFVRFTDMLHEELGHSPRLHFVCTMKRRTRISQEAEEDIRAHLGSHVFQTTIPLNVTLEEAPSHGQTIHVYDPSSIGGMAYEAFTEEFLGRLARAEVAS